MKNKSKVNPLLRNDRNLWLIVAAILSGCGLFSSVDAATISTSASAPSGGILASQLTDLGPGTQDGSRNYFDSGGPAGQTFTVASASTMGSVTMLGRGDAASSWTTQPNPFDGSENFGIQIGSVNLDGSITPLDTETATGLVAPVNFNQYITFTLANPVSLNPGTTYAFSIDLTLNTAWFGVAHSDSDVYAGGTGLNNNTSISAPPSAGQKYQFNGFVAPVSYDYVFAIQAVPEPGTLALVGLGGLGLMVANRRRRA